MLRPILLLCLSIAALSSQAQFTPGNIVLYRVGDGSASLVTTGNPIFLDELTPNGNYVQTIALPTTASGSNNAIFAAGTAATEGQITLSADGRYIIATGYTSTSSSSLPDTASSTVNRVVATIDVNGNINSSTALTDWANASNPRAAASDDGTHFWLVGGAGGIRYATLGATTSNQLNATTGSPQNIRQIAIYDGQLYVTAASSTGSVYTAASGTVTKYSLVAGTWTANGSVTLYPNLISLTGTVNSDGASVTLFANVGTFTSNGGSIVFRIDDGSGYNNTINNTITTLGTLSNTSRESYRGVVIIPSTMTLPVTFTQFTAQSKGTTTVLNWSTATENYNKGFEIQRAGDGANYTTIGFVAGHGNSSMPNNYTFIDAQPSAKNYYRLKQIDYDGKYKYSTIVQLSFQQQTAGISTYPNPAKDNLTVSLNGKTGTFQIFNTQGQIQMTKQSNGAELLNLDISSLPAGMYYSKFNSQNGSFLKQ